MQSSKSTSSRRASGPMPSNNRQDSETFRVSGNTRRTSETSKPLGQVSGNTRRTSETPKPLGQVSGITRQSSDPLKALSVSVAPTDKSTEQPQIISPPVVPPTLEDHFVPQSSADFFKPPLVLLPPSKISKGPRRNSRPEVPISERPLTWDPEHYNPDGSLRTMHKLPGFEKSYAQAMQARYIRHNNPVEREKELSLNEIFGKSEQK